MNFETGAKKANGQSLFIMAQMHERGDGVDKSMKTAIDFYNFACKQNYPPAQFLVGLMLLQGDKMKQNVNGARELWKLYVSTLKSDAGAM